MTSSIATVSPKAASTNSPMAPSSEVSRSRANTTNTATSVHSARTRADSNSTGKAVPTQPQNTPTESIASDVVQLQRSHLHSRGVPNLHDPDFGEELKRIQEEKPGEFFEGPTGVPENTPMASECCGASDGGDTPKSRFHPTKLDLPTIDVKLEQLPPPLSSKFTSPDSSIVGDGHTRRVTNGGSRNISSPTAMPPPKTPERPIDTEVRIRVTPPSHQVGMPRSVYPEGSIEGVREAQDWAHDIQQDVYRDLTRLANLAVDDEQRDNSMTAEQHYHRRLNLLLNDADMRFAYGNVGLAPIPSIAAEPGTPPPSEVKRAANPPFTVKYVNSIEFNELCKKVESLRQMNSQLTEMHAATSKELREFKTTATEEITYLQGEVDRLKYGHCYPPTSVADSFMTVKGDDQVYQASSNGCAISEPDNDNENDNYNGNDKVERVNADEQENSGSEEVDEMINKTNGLKINGVAKTSEM
ncbi:hypothetical protein EJ08DRAFT_674664 [Tothia fuscella]|uniref:Uncharacterized protein n=1 Tax=Tothia fuscella TaxID=1048955 RepID=A0A9P4P3U9_9PEZI|nr:hypothetical protein EJ08DRAFT_674664 [Tothia fuscella]